MIWRPAPCRWPPQARRSSLETRASTPARAALSRYEVARLRAAPHLHSLHSRGATSGSTVAISPAPCHRSALVASEFRTDPVSPAAKDSAPRSRGSAARNAERDRRAGGRASPAPKRVLGGNRSGKRRISLQKPALGTRRPRVPRSHASSSRIRNRRSPRELLLVRRTGRCRNSSRRGSARTNRMKGGTLLPLFLPAAR